MCNKNRPIKIRQTQSQDPRKHTFLHTRPAFFLPSPACCRSRPCPNPCPTPCLTPGLMPAAGCTAQPSLTQSPLLCCTIDIARASVRAMITLLIKHGDAHDVAQLRSGLLRRGSVCSVQARPSRPLPSAGIPPVHPLAMAPSYGPFLRFASYEPAKKVYHATVLMVAHQSRSPYPPTLRYRWADSQTPCLDGQFRFQRYCLHQSR